MIRIVSAFLISFVLIGLVACGGGSSTPPPTPTPTLPVSPSSANVIIGGSQTFSIPGATSITWNLTGPGSISSSGVYLAPSTFPGIGQNTANITATTPGGTGIATAVVVYPNNHQSFQSGPIKLGTSGGNVNDVSSTACCIGTLGSLWTRGAGTFILSNNHVLDESSFGTTGQSINQPGPGACFPTFNKTVANLSEGAKLKPTAGDDPNGCKGSTAPFCGKSPSNTDSAIAAVATGEVDATGSILDLGAAGPTSIADEPPSATLFVGIPTPGQQVAKSGRTSALTCSTIQAVSGDFFVDYDASCGGAKAFSATFNNQIVVNGANFIQAGDSGSLLVTADTARPMGLLFAAGTNGAVANPIQDVITALTDPGPPAVVPQIIGGADHPVSCAPTQSISSTQVGIGSASTLTPQQRAAATSVRDRYAKALMSDRAVRSVDIGASADSPGDGAVVINLKGTPATSIPATLDGVRTRVVYVGTPPQLTKAQLQSTIAVKQAHRDAVMGQRGIQGIAVGRSEDDPAEPAILIYTIKGIAHDPIPATIDGVRTKIMEGSRFEAK
jgi:hypothetical protein